MYKNKSLVQRRNIVVSPKIKIIIRFDFCCSSMISQPLPNFRSQFSQKGGIGSYDNVTLNQRNKKKILLYFNEKKKKINQSTHILFNFSPLLDF